MAYDNSNSANVARQQFRRFAAEQWAKKPELTAKEIRAKWAKKGKPRYLGPIELEEIRTSVEKYRLDPTGRNSGQRYFMTAPVFTRMAREKMQASVTLFLAKKPRAKPTRKTLSVTQLCRMSSEEIKADGLRPVSGSPVIKKLDRLLAETGDTKIREALRNRIVV